MASSLWQGGFNHEGLDAKGKMINPTEAFAGIGGTGGASMIVFGTIAGGAGAALTGGNFWQGAATGLIVSGLNHYAHSGDQEDPSVKTVAERKQEALDAWMSDMRDFNEFLLEARTLTAGLEFKMPSWSSVKSLFTLGTKNIMLEGKLANHLFKGTGKLADTAANRALITKISNGKSLGVDSYGKSWYAKTLGNGTQIYSYSQNGIIKGAGINQTPVNIIARYGLK